MTEPAKLTAKDWVLPIAAAIAWVALVRPGPLDLPFHWDEADVYVPGAKWAAEHGLDVRPGAIPEDFARGHPTLFYLLAAIAFALFGVTPAVAHLVVLAFTVLSLAGTYWLGATLFGRMAGAAAAALLAVTPLFMAIGNMLLPEPVLVAGTVIALLAFARGRLGVAVAIVCVLVLVKETAIFTGAAIGCALLYEAGRRGRLFSVATLRRVGIAALPLAVLLGFFAWQKVAIGYYVFPVHAELATSRPLEAESALTVFPSLFMWHARWLALVAAVVAIVLGGREALGALAAPVHTNAGEHAITRDTVLVACALLVVLNAAFFARVFWLERYALPAHPGLLVATTGALFVGLERGLHARPSWLAPSLAVAVIALAFGAGARGLHSPTTRDAEEHSFAYADVIETHRAAFAELPDELDGYVVTTWPMTVELEEPYLGYVDRPFRTAHARRLVRDPSLPVAAVIVSTASPHAADLRAAARERGLVRRAVVEVGHAPALEVWTPRAARAEDAS
jgi:hypothetical protein